ncbi:hypothetical protein [Mollivirus kamchatka]|nr:hypothetical protein [Mollivirus kamchatka]
MEHLGDDGKDEAREEEEEEGRYNQDIVTRALNDIWLGVAIKTPFEIRVRQGPTHHVMVVLVAHHKGALVHSLLPEDRDIQWQEFVQKASDLLADARVTIDVGPKYVVAYTEVVPLIAWKNTYVFRECLDNMLQAMQDKACRDRLANLLAKAMRHLDVVPCLDYRDEWYGVHVGEECKHVVFLGQLMASVLQFVEQPRPAGPGILSTLFGTGWVDWRSVCIETDRTTYLAAERQHNLAMANNLMDLGESYCLSVGYLKFAKIKTSSQEQQIFVRDESTRAWARHPLAVGRETTAMDRSAVDRSILDALSSQDTVQVTVGFMHPTRLTCTPLARVCFAETYWYKCVRALPALSCPDGRALLALENACHVLSSVARERRAVLPCRAAALACHALEVYAKAIEALHSSPEVRSLVAEDTATDMVPLLTDKSQPDGLPP